ncbi:hypothetical protein AVDCRST_MAG92-5525 [uncultured Coleofasciculus sp.]|uniref:Uncharacterized protein n=1 Tax=uncultured Coleofasciculus sp. TaxID=1267456 RepID=A0A6J4KJ63_9CYAN|nr:hypothetical protein AVDCRST_MAG92-5525 [uncultured Coleofasciculus sp.]
MQTNWKLRLKNWNWLILQLSKPQVLCLLRLSPFFCRDW